MCPGFVFPFLSLSFSHLCSCLPVIHLLVMLHLPAPRVVPFPELGSVLSSFGVFTCIMSECGSNMDGKKKHLNLTVGSFFQCWNDKKKRKGNNTMRVQ